MDCAWATTLMATRMNATKVFIRYFLNGGFFEVFNALLGRLLDLVGTEVSLITL